MSSATRSCRRLLLRTLTTGGQVGGRPPVFGGSAARAPPMQVPSSFLPGSAPSAAAFSTSSATTGPIGDGILASFGPGAEFHGTDVAGAMEALAGADAVCFDVDSTVIDEEGIDVLAESLGKGEEVALWTLKAMEGDTKFEDALAARLEIIKPSRSSIEKCLRDSPLRTSPGVDELIAALNARGTDVYFVSGGFRIMIEPVAKKVNVSKSNILANTILFDEDGNYAGFDPEEPTSADMGKPKAVGQIIAEHGYETVVMVGDGATDMQAVPPAKAFIGYGGIAERAAVRDGACWFTKSFDEMTAIVKKFKLAK